MAIGYSAPAHVVGVATMSTLCAPAAHAAPEPVSISAQLPEKGAHIEDRENVELLCPVHPVNNDEKAVTVADDAEHDVSAIGTVPPENDVQRSV